jgi:hypothetical protein
MLGYFLLAIAEPRPGLARIFPFLSAFPTPASR